MDFKKRRLFCLLAVVIIEAAAGFVYVWSVFGAELGANYGWTTTETTYVFTISNIATMLASMFLVKKFRSKFQIKTVIRISAVLLAIALIPAGLFVNNVFLFYVTYGLIGGVACALVYPVLIGYSQELYPDRAGMASGAAVGGFGMGAVLWAPLAASLIGRFGIETTFVILGIIFVSIFFIFSFFLVEPTEEFKVAMFEEAVTNKTTTRSFSEKNRREMLRSKEFIPVYLTLTLGIACGMMIITKISGVMQSEFSFDPGKAALIVSLVSFFNSFGRFAIGWISDRIGRFPAIMLVQATLTVSLVVMGLVPNVVVFLILLVFLSMAYGGISSIVAPTTGFVFGQKNIVANYSLMFSVFAIGSIIGPSLYSLLPNINAAFLTASSLSFVGLLFAFYLSRRVRVLA